MKKIFGSLLLTVLIAVSVSAEFQCRANVSYKWQREKAEAQVTYFSSVQASGADEAAAKGALSEIAEREKSKASAECLKVHENQAGCVSTKLTSVSAVMQSLNFSSRKLLEESIASDCKSQQGTCLDSVLSEPHCVEKIAASAAAAGKDTGKEAAGKEEKGKKKK